VCIDALTIPFHVQTAALIDPTFNHITLLPWLTDLRSRNPTTKTPHAMVAREADFSNAPANHAGTSWFCWIGGAKPEILRKSRAVALSQPFRFLSDARHFGRWSQSDTDFAKGPEGVDCDLKRFSWNHWVSPLHESHIGYSSWIRSEDHICAAFLRSAEFQSVHHGRNWAQEIWSCLCRQLYLQRLEWNDGF